MHADRLEEEPPLRSRIAQVLVLFVGLLVSAAVLTMPAPIWVLGILLIADAIGVGVPLLVLNHEAKRGRRNSRLERLLDRTNPNVICVSLLSTAGVLMLLGRDWGPFLWRGRPWLVLSADWLPPGLCFFALTRRWGFLPTRRMSRKAVSGRSGRASTAKVDVRKIIRRSRPRSGGREEPSRWTRSAVTSQCLAWSVASAGTCSSEATLAATSALHRSQSMTGLESENLAAFSL